jgi:uncharacterized protein YecE (DUF72 family)
VHAYVGTSGFAYDFWKGDLYPEKIDKDAMLECYARSFNAVEINATYYRIPRASVVQRWADVVPAHFRFVIKASRRITHFARLHNCKDTVEFMVAQLEPLGDKLGPVLFLLPPGLHRDVPRLRSFLGELPSVVRPVFEFRHRSWFDDEVYDALREANAAMCVGDYDSDDARRIPDGRTPLVATADFGYLRLRDEAYAEPALVDWGAAALALWDELWGFFAHEQSAPGHVRMFNDVLGVTASRTR